MALYRCGSPPGVCRKPFLSGFDPNTGLRSRQAEPGDKLNLEFDWNGFDLVVVMSHHLASDRAYLRQLAATNIGYIGLLGPAGRRDRLMNDLSDVADALQDRLHGPAGIELGGRGPGPIALAIVAEMQQFLNKRG
jgi:xanthine dehydrogenase accessory factor